MGRMIVSQKDVERLQGLLDAALQQANGPSVTPPAFTASAATPGQAAQPVAALPALAPQAAAAHAEVDAFVSKILPFLKSLLEMQPPSAAAPATGGALPPLPGPIKPIEADSYLSRLIKYIPTEIIAVYLTLHSILLTVGSGKIPWFLPWVIIAFCTLCTYLYLQRVQKVTKQMQLIISCGAFLVWVYTLGVPWFQGYEPWQGALLLPAYTLLVGILDA